MAKNSLTEKILIALDDLIQVTASVMYPYKGFGREFHKYEGSFSDAIYKLGRRGYLEDVELEGERYLKLTTKGKLKIIKKKFLGQWDRLWRIIAFDIEEERKKTRDVFRSKLVDIGCKPIQKSVWITPNDISTELEDIINLLDLEDNVDYFISKAVTGEEKYRKMFKIKDDIKDDK